MSIETEIVTNTSLEDGSFMSTKNKEILVSIIIPAYNSERFIEETIISALAQKVEKEIFIIDDCSTDNTGEIIGKYLGYDEIKYIHNDINMGVAKSRNIGIRLACGKYIAFLDSDDVWAEDKIFRQVKLLEQNKGVLCCSGRELISEQGKALHRYIGVENEITYRKLVKNNSISCSSVVLLTNVAREFFMCHDEYHEDFIMWLQILKKYKSAYGIDEPLLKSRLTSKGKSRNKIKSAYMTLGVYRYIGIGPIKSLLYLFNHLLNGIKKYYF